MKISPHFRKRPAGGILVIALIVIGFVTVGFSTWVTLLGQRGRAAEIEEYAARRRIAACNSRAAIKEYALERMITSSGDVNGVSFDPSSTGWSVTSAAAWSGYPMDSATRLAGLNGFSFTWDYPYSKLIDVTAATQALGFASNQQSLSPISSYLKTYVRSRCPVLGGDLLVIHNPNLAPSVLPVVSGNISVNGRVLHFLPGLPDTSYTARSVRFLASPGTMALRPTNLSGNAIPPSNLAWSPMTFGRVGGVTDLSGKLNVIDDSNNGGNSLRSELSTSPGTLQNGGGTAMTDPRGYFNDGLGTVTITPSIGSSNPADLPSIVIDSEVSEIIIEGQDGANLTNYARYRPAIGIVYVQNSASTRNLTTIRLRKQGGRRFLLAIKEDGAFATQNVNVIVEDTNAVSEWNMILLAENTPLTFSMTGGTSEISIAGGIQTDAPLAGPGTGQLSLNLQTDTRGLIKMSPRAAWVESIMPDKIPGTSDENTW